MLQQKVMTEIKRIAQANGLDADVEANFANCGRVFFRREFDTIATLQYDFQKEYFTASFSKGTALGNYGTSKGDCFYVKASEGSAIRAFLAHLSAQLLNKKGKK